MCQPTPTITTLYLRDGRVRSSQSYLAAGVLGEQCSGSLIGAEHALAVVPGLGLDGVLGHVRGVGARHQPCPQTVAAERRGIEPGALSSAFDNQAHCVVGEASRPHIAMLAERPKDRAFRDICSVEPGLQGAHWAGLGYPPTGNTDLLGRALLVRFAAPERDDHPFGHKRDIGIIQPYQFTAAERTRKPYQQQRAVALP